MIGRKCKGKFCPMFGNGDECEYLLRNSIMTTDGKRWSLDICKKSEYKNAGRKRP